MKIRITKRLNKNRNKNNCTGISRDKPRKLGSTGHSYVEETLREKLVSVQNNALRIYLVKFILDKREQNCKCRLGGER